MPWFRLPDSGLFQVDCLTGVMAVLILVVITNVTVFSSRYLAGDRNLGRHRVQILLLGMCVLIMAAADDLLPLLAAWALANLLLVRLMIHEPRWNAARQSGLLALKTFALGFALLAAGFWLIADSTGTTSISRIVAMNEASQVGLSAGLTLVAVAALTQSAAWPFHRWLLSSLNAPTPVSAIMHAGLVNGGGFLLVRLAPLSATRPSLLHGLFLAGLITALLGSFWKLLQTDVKRMLACSTMGQMGFMLMQCGMGLFAAAVSHLCWHGLFKAYLFLASGSVVHEKRARTSAARSPARLTLACLAGALGATAFSQTSGYTLSLANTSSLMTALAFMASTQSALGLLHHFPTVLSIPGALLAAPATGALYGLNIRLIEAMLEPLHTTHSQPLDPFYLTGFSLLLFSWIAMALNLPAKIQSLNVCKRLYLAALNASQPHPETITANRTTYQY